MKPEKIAKVCCNVLEVLSNKSFSKKEKSNTTTTVQQIIDRKVNSPVDFHTQWVDQKIKENWCYGNRYNKLKKQHPFLVPFEKLPEATKTKIELLMVIVNTLKDYE